MTQNFQNYIKAYNIKDSKRLSIDEIKESDGVYAGREIFNLFFQGTKCKWENLLIYLVVKDYRDYRGSKTFEGVQPTNFGHWHYIVDKCLTDLTESMFLTLN